MSDRRRFLPTRRAAAQAAADAAELGVPPPPDPADAVPDDGGGGLLGAKVWAVLAVVGVAFLWPLLPIAGDTPSAEAAPATATQDLPGPVDDIIVGGLSEPFAGAMADQFEGVVGGIAEGVISASFSMVTAYMADGAVLMMEQSWHALSTSSQFDVGAGERTFGTSYQIALELLGPFAAAAVLWALIKTLFGSGDGFGAEVFRLVSYVFVAVVGSGAAGSLVELLFQTTDGIAQVYVTSSEAQMRELVDGFGVELAGIAVVNTVAGSPLLFFVGAFATLAFLAVWLVVTVASLAGLSVYVFMPITLVGLVFPGTRSWMKRSTELILQAALIKPTIAAVLNLGLAIMVDADNPINRLVQATALFVLALFVPKALGSITPFATGAVLGVVSQVAHVPGRGVAVAVGAVTLASGGSKISSALKSAERRSNARRANRPNGNGNGNGGGGGGGRSGGGGGGNNSGGGVGPGAHSPVPPGPGGSPSPDQDLDTLGFGPVHPPGRRLPEHVALPRQAEGVVRDQARAERAQAAEAGRAARSGRSTTRTRPTGNNTGNGTGNGSGA